MRFIVFMKADKNTEAGVMPSEQEIAEMMKFNEELVKAGVMLAGEGLHPSSRGALVTFSGGKMHVTEGPFRETEQLVCGYWIWNVKSKEEALDWLRRSPMIKGEGVRVELRQIFEAEDFGKELTPELRKKEEELRAETERLARAKAS